MFEHGTPRCRSQAATRVAVCGTLCLLLHAFSAAPASAQGGFFVEASGDYSAVQINTADVTWQSGRVSGGWFEDGRSGWTVSAERQKRDRLVDWTGTARGFRRTGDWTVSGGLGLGADPSFSYRRSYEGEVARRVVGTLVAQGGYRYLEFTSATVHLVQPAATLYLPRGDVGARLFVVHNDSRGTTTNTLLVQGTATVHRRLRLGGGAAFGERIFDIASLSAPNASSWVGFGYAHIVANPAWSVDVGVGRAHEEPLFSQATLTVGVRRTFGARP